MSKKNDRISKLINKYDSLLVIFLLIFISLVHYISIKHLKIEWVSSLTTSLLANSIWIAVGFIVLEKYFTEKNEIQIESLINNTIAKHFPSNPSIANNIIDFTERLKDLDWKRHLHDAYVIDVLVIYHRQWIREVEDEILNIWEKGGAVNFYMPDPDNLPVMNYVSSRFGEPTDFKHGGDSQKLIERIRSTEEILLNLFSSVRNPDAKLTIHYCPSNISYAATRINNTKVILSVFEHFKAARTGPPGIVLDLSKSEHLQSQFNKEFESLAALSKKSDRMVVLHREDNKFNIPFIHQQYREKSSSNYSTTNK